MQRNETADAHQEGLPLMAAAAVQDDLLVASNDLDRLQRLLQDASDSLIGHFYAASAQLREALHVAAEHPDLDLPQLHQTMEHVAGAITAMQFQDLAAQLINHTSRRLRDCAERLAPTNDGTAAGPGQRANPVTQDAMDSGSVLPSRSTIRPSVGPEALHIRSNSRLVKTLASRP